MKRTLAILLGAAAAAALFAGLVHAVLVAAHVSEPAATTVYGLTPRRLWATTVAVLALVSVVIGGLALVRPAGRFGSEPRRLGPIVALVVGLIAAVNGALNVAVANGGPGTGNGVVGGAAAFVLGLIGVATAGLALARRRTAGPLGNGRKLHRRDVESCRDLRAVPSAPARSRVSHARVDGRRRRRGAGDVRALARG